MRIRKNKIDIFIEILCLAMLVGTVLYLIITWGSVPQEVPMHHNFAGEVDRWGSKGELLLLPILSWLLYIIITVVEQIPGVWNTGVKVTPENTWRVYRCVKYMLSTMKLIMVGLFTYLTVTTTFCLELPPWFTVLVLVLVFGDIAFWTVYMYRRR